MKQSSDDLIRTLAEDVPPVKPMARLREILTIAFLASVPLSLGWLVALGLRPELRSDTSLPPLYLAIMGMLVLMAVGGLIAGVAEAIPGRDGPGNAGRWIALVGGLAAIAALGVANISQIAGQATGSIHCFLGTAFLAVPCVTLCARFIAMGAPAHRGRAFFLSCFGGMALAGIAIHLSCTHPAPMHLVLGHALAPAFGATLALVGVLAILFVADRRSGAA